MLGQGIRLAFLLLLLPCLAQAADDLSRKFTIYRDNYGVPHIVGETEEAVFFGYGYAQAEDHLEKMMLQYRDAQGRLSEIRGRDALGSDVLRYIPYEYRWGGDYLQRLLHTEKDAVDNRKEIPPGVYKLLSAFAAGVNGYIRRNRARIPDWITPISAEDVEALQRSNYLRFYSVGDALTKLHETAYKFQLLGSNQFAIAPAKSADGRIIHVEHVHMPWANRFQNYEAHLMVPGKLDVAGISWFGSPFFLAGFNDRITWSITWNRPNIADIYQEKINPQNDLEYLYDNSWRPIRVEQETFRVKGPRGMESVTLPMYYTHHGPLVEFDRANHLAYSVKLPKAHSVTYSAGLLLIMRARNLAEFQAALAHQWVLRWNFLYSDSRNIYWVHNAAVAQRAPGFDWTRPVPGWTSATEWGPYLPFESNPQFLNPASGFLQNCNNPPWVATRNSGLDPQTLPAYYLEHAIPKHAGEEVLNARGELLLRTLSQSRKFSLDEMKALALDTYVLPADEIVPLLELAYSGKNYFPDPRIPRALQILKSWNHRSAPDSVAYTYIHFWGKAYQDLFSEDSFERFIGYSRHSINLHDPAEQFRARAAFTEALDRMQKQFGKTEVPWGEVNVVSRRGIFPMDGTGLYDVLHPDDGPEQPDGRIFDNDGGGHVMVVEEADASGGSPKQVWSLLPYGESEDPRSPHFNDQAKLHSQRQLKRFWFTPQEILAHTEHIEGDRTRIRSLPQSANR